MNPLLNADHIYGLFGFLTVVGGVIFAVLKWHSTTITEKIKAALEPVIHKVNNTQSRVDALESSDVQKEIRLAKIEMATTVLKEGQDRAEKTLNDGFTRIEKRLDQMNP